MIFFVFVVFSIFVFYSNNSLAITPKSHLNELNYDLEQLSYGGRIFLSKNSLVINSENGGVKYADEICEQEGKVYDPTSDNWAALIVDEGLETGIPSRRATIIPYQGDGQINWVLNPNSVYYRMDNQTIIGTTDSNGLFQFPLSSPITDVCVNQAFGIKKTWKVSSGSTCQDWKVPSTDPQEVGWSCSQDYFLLAGGDTTCLSSLPVFCVSPTAKRNTTSLCPVCENMFCANSTDAISCECKCSCSWEYDETCGCETRNDGYPGCKDQYPIPNNSSLLQLSTGSVITSSDRITFFGDTITSLGGYISLINTTLAAQNITPTIINRGIIGATIQDLKNGKSPFPDFYTALAIDKPTIIHIMVGVYDVLSGQIDINPNNFTSILTDFIISAQKLGIKVTLSTVGVIGERINGQNDYDVYLSILANAIRIIASSSSSGLSDLRQEFEAYETRNNLSPPGFGISQGILTCDGILPCDKSCPPDTHGNILIANSVSKSFIQISNK